MPSLPTHLPVNYLAHLYLADRAGADLAGAILGDFIRGSDLSRFSAEVEHSIRLHRRLDALTDRHPLVRARIADFPDGSRRYAPVIVDVLFDHALTIDWPQYSDEPLRDFIERSAEAVVAAADLFPDRKPSLANFAPLLQSYADEAGIELALHRIAQRLRQPEPMLDAIIGWPDYIPALRRDLPALMKDLLQAARD